jgi:hypothetical protein
MLIKIQRKNFLNQKVLRYLNLGKFDHSNIKICERESKNDKLLNSQKLLENKRFILDKLNQIAKLNNDKERLKDEVSLFNYR